MHAIAHFSIRLRTLPRPYIAQKQLHNIKIQYITPTGTPIAKISEDCNDN